jgi:RNA polymerase sigma factor (TIGR02999 family)
MRAALALIPDRAIPPAGRRRSDAVRGHGMGGLAASLAMTEVTRILSEIERGDPKAAEQLLPLVYDELRALAAQKLAREKPGQTLQPTALVHEAYLRLTGEEGARGWDGGGHFFAAAAVAMRRILVEGARRKRSLKRGGDLARHDLDELQLAEPEIGEDLLALDEALDRLAVRDPVKARLVELRHFAGLTLEQAALALGLSTTTAHRHWTYARAWLHQAILSDGAAGAGDPLPGEKDRRGGKSGP